MASGCAHGDCDSLPSVVCIGTESSIEVGLSPVGPSDRELGRLFGLHSLWWGTQDDLADASGEVGTTAIAALRASGVNLIRYGGGANELNWRQCVGPIGSRAAQKVVDWAGPMRCRFGIAEYERLNQAIGANTSWYIANLVGYERQLDSADVMSKAAGEMAQVVAAAAGRRARYWELGNELERGRLKWSASNIVERSKVVSEAILQADPKAHVVVPLLEYKPAWIRNDSEHNLELIRRLKAISSDYALHIYYDNPPEGPSVANRLAVVSRTAQLVKQEGVAKPSIWITEHARWPAGSPAKPDWNKTWYQTGNFDSLLSTADFIAGLTQIDMVAGAMWHGLRAGPWNFLVKDSGDIEPGLIARLFQFLTPPSGVSVLETHTTSAATSDYFGGYAIRGSAFIKNVPVGGPPTVYVWLVNRSGQTASVMVNIRALASARRVQVSQRSLVEAQNQSSDVRGLVSVTTGNGTSVIKDGRLKIDVPARSVSVVELTESNN